MDHRSKLIIAGVALAFVGCEEQGSVAPRGDVFKSSIEGGVCFNQALLKDILPFLSQRTGKEIVMDPDLAKVENLWVNYQTNQTCLEDILIGIACFIKKEHHIEIAWSLANDKVVLRLDQGRARN